MIQHSNERRARAQRWYRGLLTAYPLAFRLRFEVDLVELFADLYESQALDAPVSRRIGFWRRIVIDTIRHGLHERISTPRRLPLRAHRAKGPSFMSLLIEDLHHALRALRQRPALAGVIVMTLALAIGANSAIFTVINAVLLRPLPFHDPARVVALYEVGPRGRDSFVSMALFQDWQRTLTSINGLSVMGPQSVNLTSVAEPDRLRGGFITAGFFDMLGVRPVIGRGFAAGEDQPGAAKTAVLTHATWQQRFGGDPAILSRSLMLNNEPHQIIGVLPPAFEFPIDAVEIWLPYSSYPVQDRGRSSRNSMVFGRVPPDVTFEQAALELRQVTAGISRAHPDTSTDWSARFESFTETALGTTGSNLRLLMGTVVFVLLIACANIANLLLARASARQREMAVRAALGASRGRLIRQLLTENLLVAAAGGVIGLLLGAALTDGMLTLLPTLPRLERVAPDVTVVAFTAALSIATGLAFGILPALRTSRPNLRATLSDGTRAGEGRGSGRVRGVLVVAELALSLILLVGAGLFIQSVTRQLNVELGFNPQNVLTFEYRLPRNKYSSPQQQSEFHRRVIDEMRTVSGVHVAALAWAMPQSGNGLYMGFWRTEDPQPPRDAMPRAQYNTVSADYFRAMEIPVIAGRVCGREDTPDAPVTILVNQALAEQVWPGQSALGKRLRTPDIPVEAIVAGVVGNTRPQLLSQPIAPQIYGCLSQQPGTFMTVVAKTVAEPMSVARALQQAVWRVDPDQPMWKIRSSESMIAATMQSQRFLMLLMTLAAALALLLAGLGTYSVLSYTVQRRAREVGVRMALGATRRDVISLVLRHTILLIAIGVAAGLAGAYALSRLLAAQLYEISPRDPETFAVTALTLVAVALLAAWLPTWRATAVDPAITLRAE